MRKGLVFGKFMPLHRGHELLINTALSQVDELTILVYDCKPKGNYPPMPVSMRLKWLNELYPQAHAILAVPDPYDGTPASSDGTYADEYAKAIDYLGTFDIL